LKDKDDYMGKELTVTASGQARNELAYLDAFVAQSGVKKTKDLADIEKLGLELESEKFENVRFLFLLFAVAVKKHLAATRGAATRGAASYSRWPVALQVAAVKSREGELQTSFLALEDAAKKKRPILEDHLAREVDHLFLRILDAAVYSERALRRCTLR
jgi:hypothetical protein